MMVATDDAPLVIWVVGQALSQPVPGGGDPFTEPQDMFQAAAGFPMPSQVPCHTKFLLRHCQRRNLA